MAWIAAIGAIYGGYSADQQKKAMEKARRNAQANLGQSLDDARAQYRDYADIGKRDGLYKLAALMGDDRFGSQEAIDLYEMQSRVPTLENYIDPAITPYKQNKFLSSLGFKSKARKKKEEYESMMNRAREQYTAGLAAYNAKKSGLESAIAKQKAEGTYRVGSDYIADSESYKFGFDQGQNNMLRGMNATQGIFSGGALKEMDKFSQDYAGSKFQEEFNRLATMAGLGQNASAAMANTSLSGGTSLANLALAGGDNMANYYSNMNNVVQGSLGNAAYANRMRSSYGGNRNPYSGWAQYEKEREIE